MSEHEVVAFLGRKIVQAMNNEDDDISETRKENFNYYIGAEYGNERDGYSKFVTRETLETVEWVLPSVLRVFLSGDKIVAFEPQGPDDEESADQETDITNYYVMRANRDGEGGFLSLHHWFKDALMNPNGYLKVYMEEATYTDVGMVTGLTDIGVQMLVDDENVEILEQRTRRQVIVDGQPQDVSAVQMAQTMSPVGPMANQQVIELYDLKIRTTEQVMQLRLDPVPPEECLIDNDCRSINIDTADFVCHRTQKPYTQLVREGYDKDMLDSIGQGENHDFNDEKVNRLFYSDENPDDQSEDDPSMRMFWVHDCTAWFDYSGNGEAEQRHVVLIGDRVFENEETNHQPMVAISSILMPHKHNGMSYVDIVKDLQILLSILTRQLLDNIYSINVRRKVFSEDALTDDGSTMEAILNTQAEWIPVRGPAQNAFAPEPTHSIINEIMPVIQHFDEKKTVRTGVTPETQVDPNALQEVREDVFANAMDRASQRVEMLVRIFAETGVRQLMLKVHQLLRSHWDVKRAIKIRGKWVDSDPQGWRQRTDMSINVGLGFNTKHQQLRVLSEMLAMQKEAMAAGLTNPDKIYNTLERWVNAGGVGNVHEFYIDPKSPEYQPPQPPPDPNMILAQAQAQALQQEQQRKNQLEPVQTQQKVAEMQQNARIKNAELNNKQLDRQLKIRELAIREKELERDGMLKAGELEAKIENINADTEVKRSQADKNMVEAAHTAIEASETYNEAVKIVAEANNANEGEDNDIDEGSAEKEAGSDQTEE